MWVPRCSESSWDVEIFLHRHVIQDIGGALNSGELRLTPWGTVGYNEGTQANMLDSWPQEEAQERARSCGLQKKRATTS
jgi:hypothetical protein